MDPAGALDVVEERDRQSSPSSWPRSPIRARHEGFERPSNDQPPLAVLAPELGGGQHLRCKGAPLTNLYTTLLSNLGVPVERIGDSTGTLSTL
jgi:hypothetical protein